MTLFYILNISIVLAYFTMRAVERLPRILKKAARLAKYACYDIIKDIRAYYARIAEKASTEVRYSRG